MSEVNVSNLTQCRVTKRDRKEKLSKLTIEVQVIIKEGITNQTTIEYTT